jgi:hypothetical protein
VQTIPRAGQGLPSCIQPAELDVLDGVHGVSMARQKKEAFSWVCAYPWCLEKTRVQARDRAMEKGRPRGAQATSYKGGAAGSAMKSVESRSPSAENRVEEGRKHWEMSTTEMSVKMSTLEDQESICGIPQSCCEVHSSPE